MKKIRSYSSIWSVQKVIYAINDLQLPFLITFAQMTWSVVSLLVVILFGNMRPFSMINGALLKYLGISVSITWFMSQKIFDGKLPYGFLKSVCSYAVWQKTTYAGKSVKLGTKTVNELITVVKSEHYGISD